MLSKSGIYKITNLETNEIYVGSSVNIERRWGDHKTRMKKKEGRAFFNQHNKFLSNGFYLHRVTVLQDVAFPQSPDELLFFHQLVEDLTSY